MKYCFLSLLFFFVFASAFSQNHQIFIQDDSVEMSNRKAILVLHGLEGNKKSRKKIREAFECQGYDVLVPDYICGKSFDSSLTNFEQFVGDFNLKSYGELNVVCMIMGGYTFNTYLNAHPDFEINSIVFDRSPIQERAAKVVSTKIPLITKIVVGKVVFDIADYQFIPMNREVSTAFIIEFKANYFMRVFKKKTLKMGPLDFNPDNMNQPFDDYMYVPYSHTEMYYNMDKMSQAVIYFIKNGKFPVGVKQTPYTQNPFKARVKQE